MFNFIDSIPQPKKKKIKKKSFDGEQVLKPQEWPLYLQEQWGADVTMVSDCNQVLKDGQSILQEVGDRALKGQWQSWAAENPQQWLWETAKAVQSVALDTVINNAGNLSEVCSY